MEDTNKKDRNEMEENIKPDSSVSGTFSPKVSRPKLPSFARGLSLPNSSKDKGREDIKTILEDIEKLKKFNFDEFKRPKHQHPSAFATLPRRSQSATVTPCHSPRIMSPTVDDPRSTHDRLKILTNYLKSRSGKHSGEQNIQSAKSRNRGDFKFERDFPLSYKPSPEQKVGSENAGGVKNLSDQSKLRTPDMSPNTVMSVSLPHYSISSNTRKALDDNDSSNIHLYSHSREQHLDADFHGKPGETSPTPLDTSAKSLEDDKYLKTSEEEQEQIAEDEGVSEISEAPKPIFSAQLYHPAVVHNKDFLTISARDPSSVQQPLTSAEDNLPVHSKLSEHGHQEQQEVISKPRFRRNEASPTGILKASPRFITHPPHKKGSLQEEGSMDSNGFAALKATSDRNNDQYMQQSQTSLADSYLTSEEADGLTYQFALDSVAEAPDSHPPDSEKQERKNSKMGKHKSRSDPSGDKSKESFELTPCIDTSQSHSTPTLLKNVSDSLTEDNDQISHSDHTLSPSPQSIAVESSESQSSEDGSDVEDNAASRHSSSRSQRTHLTIPSNLMSHRHILRSSSSAEDLQTRKHMVGSDSSEQDFLKCVGTTDENISSPSTPVLTKFPTLTDSSAITNFPPAWKDQTSTSDSPERDLGFIKDKRYHIVEELYRNEREYVEALQVLKQKYMAPLKNSSNVDDAIVDNIFYMIPEILMHHSVYLDLLDKVWKNWDSKTSTTGDLILAIFSKQTVLESYLSFVENYKTSGKVIENALTTKSSMQKFIEQCQKDSGSKLSMKDLIVRPIQRIPRYELLIQRLLDNTPADHPDHPLLQQACRAMHELAMKIGTVTGSQHEEDMQETLKKLELLLITDLVAPERVYIRHDMVQLLNKKDPCCVWLFSDLIILSSVKRKSGPVTRKVSIILKTPGGQDFTENLKHKVWLRVGLDCLEIVKAHGGTVNRKSFTEREQIENDLQILDQISELCSNLVSPHQSMDEAVQDLNAMLTKQLSDIALQSTASESNKVELLVTTQEGVLHIEMGFVTTEKRAAWEMAFSDAKNKLSLLTNKRVPEFLQPLQITKTRAGMQFSCAAPIDGLNSKGCREVWVCNSDGYVGHMCLLSLQPEPVITLSTPVPGCNARILCICAVPAFGGAFRRRSSQKSNTQRSAGSDEQQPRFQGVYPEREEDRMVSPSRKEGGTRRGNRTLEHPRHREGGREDDEDNTEEGYQSESDSSDDDDDNSVSFLRGSDLFVGDLLSDEELHHLNVSELTQGCPDPVAATGTWEQDPSKSTMWLGTEDGCIHIFQCTDSVKTTKNKSRIQHGSPVHCIVCLDNKIFVSLINGDLIVYKRDSEGLWDTEHPYTRTIGSATAPITRMLAVAGKLWCGCQNTIHVISPLALNIEESFQVMSDPSRAVQCMVCSGLGVWVACQHSSKINLFHATTYDFLLEVSVAQAVSQKLKSADDIIRQHKAACLRITALLVCKDLLWVGTSAGIILTIPIPNVTSTTTHGTLGVPSITGLVYGHTGHVRFLTAVELPNVGSNQKSDRSVSKGRRGREGVVLPDVHRRSSVAAMTTMATRMLVISGGDGYEDFRNSSSSDLAGRDDSTNHLLLWQV